MIQHARSAGMGLILAIALIAGVAAQSAAPSRTFEIGHGETWRLTCDYRMTVDRIDRSTVDLTCQPRTTSTPTASVAPTASPTAPATATPTSTAAPTSTASPTNTAPPTPSPTASPTATQAPTATPSPTATATPLPPPDTSVVGYGATTVGGSGGTVTSVTSLSQLRTLLKASGHRILNLPATRQTWDLAGSDLAITSPNVTLNGGGVIFKGAQIKVLTSQVILRNVSSHPGDQAGAAADVDAFTLNGNRACRANIVLDHVEGIWGPDVGGLTILGCVTDVTVQHSIFGEGLLHSAHPESHDADGHGLALNISDDVGPGMNAKRITIYGTLVTTSQSRQPRVIGANCADFIDSVFYNFAEGPQGNPESLNLIGDTWKKGPAPAAAGIPFTSLLWRYQPDADVYNQRLDNTVYIAGQQVIGYTPQTPSGDDAAVLVNSPRCSPSVTSIGAAAAYSMVTSSAGPTSPMSDQTARLRANVLNGTGVYYNGDGYPAPNPTWP